MKIIKYTLLTVVIIAIIVTIFTSLLNVQKMVVIQSGNSEKLAIPITLGHFQDSDCGMVINDLTYSSQVVSPDGNTWFFHDHGGMVKWLEKRPFKDYATIWVYAKDSKKYILAKDAYFSRVDDTPMGYGFGAYEKREENLIPYDEMRLLMLRGEDLNNPQVRQILGVN
ncbi:MAG: hypothetical protein U9N42_00110 [Campylobacterota bacterium]|nr:hypothetical protein [Campylobacterota bacterium]